MGGAPFRSASAQLFPRKKVQFLRPAVGAPSSLCTCALVRTLLSQFLILVLARDHVPLVPKLRRAIVGTTTQPELVASGAAAL